MKVREGNILLNQSSCTEPCVPARSLVRVSRGCAAEQWAVGQEWGHSTRLGAETPTMEQCIGLFTSP